MVLPSTCAIVPLTFIGGLAATAAILMAKIPAVPKIREFCTLCVMLDSSTLFALRSASL
jgi:hypothetical protein